MEYIGTNGDKVPKYIGTKRKVPKYKTIGTKYIGTGGEEQVPKYIGTKRKVPKYKTIGTKYIGTGGEEQVPKYIGSKGSVREKRVKEKVGKEKKAKGFVGKAISKAKMPRFGSKGKLKKVLKKQRVTVVIKEPEVESILEDPNRYFKKVYEEDKRRFFFK